MKQKRELVLYYVIKRFCEKYNRPLEGHKKLQKLLFLVEHFDLSKNKPTPSSGLTGYVFRIWYYGPYSSELKDDIVELVKEGIIEERVEYIDDFLYTDEFPKRIYRYLPKKQLNVEGKLDRQTITKIDRIIELFGDKTPYELEKIVSNLLNLTPLKKLEVWGMTLDEYILSETQHNNPA